MLEGSHHETNTEERKNIKANFPELSVTIDTLQDFLLAKYIMSKLKYLKEDGDQIVNLTQRYFMEIGNRNK